MKLKAKKFLTFLVVCSLFLGNFMFMPFSLAKAENSANVTPEYKISIVVSEAQTAAIVLPQVLSASGLQTSSCSLPTFMPGNFVQEQALLNLNQPGSCFNLSVAEFPKFQPSLSVEPFVRVVSRVEVLPTAKISQGINLPVSLPLQKTTAIPAPLATVVLLYFGMILVFVQYRKIFFETIYKNLSIVILQVMRC